MAICLSSSLSHAFDILPEYQGLSETDLQKFERPTDIDSEYQLIVNAFAVPLEWEQQWHSAPRALDLSIGSISNKQFWIYSRLKLEADLTEDLKFHFQYLSQRDREVDQNRHVLELSQRVWRDLRVNLYGEASLYKRENDLGLALVLPSGGGWSHRIYSTLHDLTRAEHNDQADRFEPRRDPRSMGWTSIYAGDGIWTRFGGRYDQPVTWLRPQEQRIFRYEKQLLFGDLIYEYAERRKLGFRVQWDSTFESQEADSATSPAALENWRLERLQARLSHLFGTREDRIAVEAAFTHVHRRWTDQAGRRLQHYNELPSVALHFRGPRRAENFDRIRLELENNWFSRFGDLTLGADQKRRPSERRLQTAYEFALRGRARLMLAFNFDIDELTPAPTFEGGNGMFRAEF